jgi:sialic acid synthase SpsE
MADMNEIGEALHVLLDMGIKKEDITILHCNTEYPTPFQDVNLSAMVNIGKEYEVAVGYSDHTLGIEVPIAAVAMGATMIEKHFTTDKTLEGPDHQGSLEPHELSQMVQTIRNIELSRGNGIKEPSPSEFPNKDRVRKSIHLVRGVDEGHVLSEEDLIMKRPGDGISPMLIESVIGKRVKLPLDEGAKLSLEHLQ